MPFAMPDPGLIAVAVLAMAATGAAAGFLSGLFGIGAGVVIVPALSFVLPPLGVDEEVRQKVAVAISLVTMIPTSWIGARRHWAWGSLDLAFVRSLTPGVIAGTLLGSWLIIVLHGTLLTLAFAVVALAVAAEIGLTGVEFRLRDSFPTGLARHAIAASLALVSTVMGIGGGTIGVPVLVMLGVPILRAVAAATALGLVIAIPSTLIVLASPASQAMPPFSVGYVNLAGVALIAPFAMLATSAGVRAAFGMRPLMLKRAFALLLLVIAARMFQTALT